MTLDVETDGSGRALCWLVWRMEHFGSGSTLCGVFTAEPDAQRAASVERANEVVAAERVDSIPRRFTVEQSVLNHTFWSTG